VALTVGSAEWGLVVAVTVAHARIALFADVAAVGAADRWIGTVTVAGAGVAQAAIVALTVWGTKWCGRVAVAVGDARLSLVSDLATQGAA
jgi:hypothetical protein